MLPTTVILEDMELDYGQIIGSYRVIRRLGAGGMGCVYEVEHVNLGVRYALKVLSPELGLGEGFRRRFSDEGRILARLNHPNLVRVIDLDVDDTTGLPYFAMDLILGADGEPHTLADAGRAGVEEDQLKAWFDELCSAVDYIHAHGVVHRDIKLENVLVDCDGHLRLSDFGISRIVDAGLRQKMQIMQTIVTGMSGQSSLVMGTQGYMAPEVLRGETAIPASDVYSLGVVFFRLLTNVWYDPALGADDVKSGGGSMNIVEMLKFFEYDWSLVLPKMLAFDPKSRPTALLDLSVRLKVIRWHGFRWRLAAVILGGAIALVGAIYGALRLISRPAADAARDSEFAEAFGLSALGEKSK